MIKITIKKNNTQKLMGRRLFYIDPKVWDFVNEELRVNRQEIFEANKELKKQGKDVKKLGKPAISNILDYQPMGFEKVEGFLKTILFMAKENNKDFSLNIDTDVVRCVFKMPHFGEILQVYSAEKVADSSGLSLGYLSNIKQGGRANVDGIRKIIEVIKGFQNNEEREVAFTKDVFFFESDHSGRKEIYRHGDENSDYLPEMDDFRVKPSDLNDYICIKSYEHRQKFPQADDKDAIAPAT